MRLHVWGTDFRRSAGEQRRHLFIAPEDRSARLERLRALGFEDLVYLPTCNRIEFYTTAKDPFSDLRPQWVELLKSFGLPEEAYFQGYHLEGKAAVRHLLRVASSLESLVIGEPQILGQLKDALAAAGEVHPSLKRVFQLAFETAKKVRSETSIAEKSISIATLGIQRMKSREREFPLKKIVVVGRSPISRIVLQWALAKRPDAEIVWVNRSLDKLAEYPEFERVKKLDLSQFLQTPEDFSHLVTATSSREPLFGASFFRKLNFAQRMVLDFAEPIDVVDAHLVPGVTVVKLEGLQEEALRNATERKRGVEEAEAIIDAALRSFCLQQKEAPLMKDFNEVEPSFEESFRMAWELIHKEIPDNYQPKVRKWAENLVKKNLHLSREHLRAVLRKVTDPEPAPAVVEE